MNAHEANKRILTLLRQRHAEDINDAEVIAGSAGMRIDFMAIACSWAKPLITAYEIKVSRQDFLKDHKWPSYLPHCKQLNFVTAPGVATLAEIPEQCGWQELSANGARLMTKKKAPARDIDPKHEARLYKVLLMRKSGIADEDPAAFWDRWLSEKRENRQLGRLVRYEIAATAAERLRKMERAVKDSNERSERLEKVREILKQLGLDPERMERVYTFTIEREIRRALEIQNSGAISKAVADLLDHIAPIRDRLADFQNKAATFQKTVRQEMDAESKTA